MAGFDPARRHGIGCRHHLIALPSARQDVSDGAAHLDGTAAPTRSGYGIVTGHR
jgi:hypothetical protein